MALGFTVDIYRQKGAGVKDVAGNELPAYMKPFPGGLDSDDVSARTGECVVSTG
ncbi:hypothetical protein KIPB_004612, partial [Kipferlia bialata]|eukprot:g4612.t1